MSLFRRIFVSAPKRPDGMPEWQARAIRRGPIDGVSGLDRSLAFANGNLAGLGEDRQRVLTVRAALRALPAIGGHGGISDGVWSISTKTAPHIELHALRFTFIAWCELVVDGVRPGARDDAWRTLAHHLEKIDSALPEFYKGNYMGSDYGCGAMEDNIRSARRAVALVEAAHRLEYHPQAFDCANPDYASIFDTEHIFGPEGRDNMARWIEAQKEALAADAALLVDPDCDLRTLAMSRLWPSDELAALETTVIRHPRNWGSTLGVWMRERKDGHLVLGQPVAAKAERIRRLASLPASFWDRPDTEFVLRQFDYALHGDLENPNWGA